MPIRRSFDENGRRRSVSRSLSVWATTFLCMCFAVTAAAQKTYANYTVGLIQTPTATANCAYFMLVGVAQADPIAPGNAWFAIPATQNGFAEVYATLVAAKLSGATVTAATTGALADSSCGTFAGTLYVQLAP